MTLKRIGVMSCGKILGALYTGIGLVLGLIYGGIILVVSLFGLGDLEGASPFVGIGLGLGVVLLAPILYGLLGFIGGMLMAALYNFTARIIGGLELEIE